MRLRRGQFFILPAISTCAVYAVCSVRCSRVAVGYLWVFDYLVGLAAVRVLFLGFLMTTLSPRLCILGIG